MNKEGGYSKEEGKKLPVELVFANDGGKAQTSSSAVEKLCTTDKVDFLIGANIGAHPCATGDGDGLQKALP